MGLYQKCPNYSPGVKFDPALGGVTTFTWVYIGKTLEISVYLAIRPRLTKLCMQLHLVDSTKSAQINALSSNLAPPRWSQVLHGLIKGKL